MWKQLNDGWRFWIINFLSLNLTLDRNDGAVKLGLCQQMCLQQQAWLTGVNMQGHTFAVHKDMSASQREEIPTELCVQQLGYLRINEEKKNNGIIMN